MDEAGELGPALRAHRLRAGWSQEVLADRTGISVRTVRDIERGRVREPRPATLRLLFDALQLDLSTQAGSPTGSNGTAPGVAQLPSAVGDFTGHAALLTRLTQVLAAGPPGPGRRLVVIGGPAGVGKTTLAVQLGHRLRAMFPDGQLYAELRGAQTRCTPAGEVLAAFLRSLGDESAAVVDDDQELAARLRSGLAGRRMLLLLDDARHAAQVRPLLPGVNGCAVLVTTRRRLADLEGAHFVTLSVLDGPDADTLFARVAGPERVAEDSVAAQRITAACRGLPLALRIAGARAAAWPERPLDQLADLLAGEQGRLDQLAVGDLEVRASIGLSYQILPPEVRRAFRLLGALDVPDVPSWALPALLDRTEDEAARLLEQLIEVHLVQLITDAGRSHPDREPNRVRLHDLIRLFAQEQAVRREGENIRAAVARAAQAWLALGDVAELRSPGGLTRTVIGPGPRWQLPRALVDEVAEHADAWFVAERMALRSLVEQCVELGLDEQAWDLAGSTVRFLEVRGHYGDLGQLTTLGLVAARRQGDRRAEAFLLRVQGDLHADLDQYDTAADRLELALTLAQAAGDEREEAWSLRALGSVLRAQGRVAEAVDRLTRAEAIFHREADRGGVAECHYGLGAIAREQGQLDEAVGHYEQALTTFRDQGDAFNESLVLTSAARVHQLRGDTARALGHLERALLLCRQIEHPGCAAWASSYLGDLHLAAGRSAQAEALLTDSLDLSRRLGDRYCEAVDLEALGRLRLAAGDVAAAEDLLRSSIALADACRLTLQQGRGLISLGDAQLSRGAREEAVVSWRAAQSLLSPLGFPEAGAVEQRLSTVAT